MRRLALLFAAVFAALLASTVVAAPSYAATSPVGGLPDCATALNGGAGASSSCVTQGPPPVACNSCGVRRTVNVVVTAGRVDAKLVCDGLTYATHVDGPGTGTIGAWGGQSCTVTLTATADGTIAAATSTASYVVASA
jgi:hypothetical protein